MASGSIESRRLLIRNVVFALIGVGVLILNDYYSGPGQQLVDAYVGNAGVAFALYLAVVVDLPTSRVGAS